MSAGFLSEHWKRWQHENLGCPNNSFCVSHNPTAGESLQGFRPIIRKYSVQKQAYRLVLALRYEYILMLTPS